MSQRESIVTKNYPSIIYPGIYFYENENGSMCLSTAYQQEIILDQYFNKIFNCRHSLKQVKICKLEEPIQSYHPDIREMLLYIGTEEALHIYIKVPTEPYGQFLVFQYIGSEMTNKEYCLWNDKEGEEYRSFSTFIYYLYKSNLVKEILYIQEYKEIKAKEQKEKTRTKVLKHLSSQDLFKKTRTEYKRFLFRYSFNIL